MGIGAQSIHILRMAYESFYLAFRQVFCHGNKGVAQLVGSDLWNIVGSAICFPSVIVIGLFPDREDRAGKGQRVPTLVIQYGLGGFGQKEGAMGIFIFPIGSLPMYIDRPTDMDYITCYIIPSQPD